MNHASDRAPAQIAIEAGWELSCPWHGRIAVDRCCACPFLQGTLDGPDLQLLCGFGRGSPLRRASTLAVLPAEGQQR
jgi:hypothetical protein